MYGKQYYPQPLTDKIFQYYFKWKKVRFGRAINKNNTIYYKEEGKEVADIKRNAYTERHSK